MVEINVSTKKIRAYRFFGAMYNLFSRMIGKKSGIFFVMTHDGSNYGNCGVMKTVLSEKGYRCFTLRRHDTNFGQFGFDPVKAFRFFFVKPFRMAQSEMIFLDNTFLPMAFCNVPDDVRVCMLWHGTGTIKKFGLDTTTGVLRELEKSADSKITHLFVASEYTKKIYAGCFGLSEDRIYVTGSPRCDDLFRYAKEQENAELSKELSEAVRELQGDSLYRKPKSSSHEFTVLYAPTFRGDGTPGNIFDEFKKYFAITRNADITINTQLRFHPHIAGNMANYALFFGSEACTDVSNVSNINMLLKKADLLITDYSSICYDYSILGKPMIFYAPDLRDFDENDRGTYETYEDIVPGPIVTSTEDMARKVLEIAGENAHLPADRELKLKKFRKLAFKYSDDRACDRIMKVLGL